MMRATFFRAVIAIANAMLLWAGAREAGQGGGSRVSAG